MCARLLKNSNPKRILVVSQTNIGDVVLTCPVIDILRRDFPQARMDVVIGPKAVSLFGDNPHFGIKVFDKQAPLKQKCAWFLDLYKEHYDCVVDLRHTMLSFFLHPRYATPLLTGKGFTGHKKDGHLNRLRLVYPFDAPARQQAAILTTRDDERFFESNIRPLIGQQRFIVIAPGAADAAKRWHTQGFALVADHLALKYKIVFVGDVHDMKIIQDIQSQMKSPSFSLAGGLSLRQLAFLLKKCAWAMTHDSGVMHLACYFNVPVLSLWGPTPLEKYAPWSFKSITLRRNQQCARCADPKSPAPHQCMSLIQAADVIEAAQRMPQ